MSLMSAEYSVPLDVYSAVRAFIRSQGDGCIVSMTQLLDELSETLGDQFGACRSLNLIETLWADPHIDQVPDTGWVEFAWNEVGR
jgi:hypothetical protein